MSLRTTTTTTTECTLKMIRHDASSPHCTFINQRVHIVDEPSKSTTELHHQRQHLPSSVNSCAPITTTSTTASTTTSTTTIISTLPPVGTPLEKTVKINSRYRLSGSSRLASPSPSRRSGSVPPGSANGRQSSASNHSSGSAISASTSTSNLNHYREIFYNMSYVLISTEDFHRGPTRISTIDPYLHEKVPLTVIKDTLYFQAEPQYDPHGRFWKFRVEDAPVRVLNKLLDLGYKVLTGTSVPNEHQKQIGHAWTLVREPTTRSSNLLNTSQ